MDCFDIIVRVIQLVFTGFALYIAYKGLRTWEYQLKGSYKFDLAKKTSIELKKTSRLFVDLRERILNAYELETQTLRELKQGDQPSNTVGFSILTDPEKKAEDQIDSLMNILYEGEIIYGKEYLDECSSLIEYLWMFDYKLQALLIIVNLRPDQNVYLLLKNYEQFKSTDFVDTLETKVSKIMKYLQKDLDFKKV